MLDLLDVTSVCKNSLASTTICIPLLSVGIFMYIDSNAQVWLFVKIRHPGFFLHVLVYCYCVFCLSARGGTVFCIYCIDHNVQYHEWT